MEQPLVISTKDLGYRYSKEAQILDNIDLQVERGSIYGFLGPNGSGKTTTLSLLLGLLPKQQGEIRIFGEELANNRISILKKVGSLVETPSLYGHLTAKENLEVYRNIYGASKERIEKVLSIVELEDTGKKLVKRFSLGMKQRLSIALALLPSPELLILDEPTNGLDPNGIIQLRKLIRRLNKEHGITILVSSHILAEVEKMVTHIGIISKGKLLFQGKLEELRALQQNNDQLLVDTSDNEKAIQLMREHAPVRSGELIAFPVKSKEQAGMINQALVQHELQVYHLSTRSNNLEQLFIDLTTATA